MYSREIISMFFVGQAFGLVKDFNIVIYSDNIDVTNVKLAAIDNDSTGPPILLPPPHSPSYRF